MADQQFHSGFVAVVGRPNAGKSTLVNKLVKSKVAITSDKPQTTRNRIMAVLDSAGSQMVFMDTPGFHKPKDALGKGMLQAVRGALEDVDAVLFLVDATAPFGKGDEMLAGELRAAGSRVMGLASKADLVDEAVLVRQEKAIRAACPGCEVFAISAKKGLNLDVLVEKLETLMPPGPRYFPAGQVSDQPEAFVIAEYIREKAFRAMREEVPYSIAVEVEKLSKRKGRDLVDVSAVIYVERDSQKGIIIGDGGQVLKKIGTQARKDAERLLGSPINLQLWVKVRRDWRERSSDVRAFGYGDDA